MYLKTLKKVLDICTVKYIKENDKNQDVKFVLPVEEISEMYTDNVLYFAEHSSFTCPSHILTEKNSLLLYAEQNTVDPLILSAFANVIVTYDYQEYRTIIVMLREALLDENKFVKGNYVLMDKIIGQRPLQEIIDHISALYGHYTDILDNALNILATSSNMMPPDINIIVEHSYSMIKPGVIQYLRTRGSLEQMRHFKNPIYIEDSPRNTYVYSTPIFKADVLNIGFLTIFVEQGEILSPVAQQYLADTARMLSLVIQRDNVSTLHKSTYFTHLLSCMLDGSTLKTSYRERLMVFGYKLKKYMWMAVIPLKNNIPSSLNIDSLCETLHPMFPNSLYVVYDMYIVFLISENEMIHFEDNSMLNEFLTFNLLKIGISRPFEDESFVKENFETAKAALNLGERYDPGRHIYFYEDYKFMDIFDEISKTKNIHLLCSEPLIRLIREDDTEGHSLVQTLLVYMNHQFSVQKTCDALYIHRNTLYYRIQKIKEIMGCDFMEYRILIDISMTFMILKYLNLLPNELLTYVDL